MASFTGLPYPPVRRERTPDIDDIFRGHPIRSPAPHATTQQQQRDPHQLHLDQWVMSSHASVIGQHMSYADPTQSAYYISSAPDAFAWGDADLSHVLCDAASGIPLTIDVVGSVHALSFSISGFDGRAHVKLALQFLRDADYIAAQRFLRMSSSTPWYSGTHFECGRAPTAPHIGGLLRDHTVSAGHVPLTLSDLSVGDVVCVRCTCFRWHRDRRPSYAGVDWSCWFTGFHLKGLSLVAKKPRMLQ